MRRLVTILLCLCVIADGQTRLEERDKLYADVRAVVFPTVPSLRGHLATVVIEFTPSFSPESQLVLDFTEDGATASYVRLAEMLSKTIDNLPPGRRDPREIAAKIKAERSSKTLDSKTAKQNLDALWDALAKSTAAMKRRAGHITLDGTNYRVSIETFIDSIVVDSQDANAEADRVTGDSEIVRWANRMRLGMAK